MKLGLGTVQFGQVYGISNRKGQTDFTEVGRILATAQVAGVDFLDTAPGYGTSEAVLGRSLCGSQAFSIITKVPAIRKQRIEQADCATVVATFQQSLRRLGRERVYGLLAHRAEDLLADNGEILFDTMVDLRQRGLVEKIGASVYSAREIDALLARYRLDLLQVPVNAFDQRLLKGGYLRGVHQSGVSVHARSIFLQGLLSMDPGGLPGAMEELKPQLKQFRCFAEENACLPLHAALKFVSTLDEIDAAIIGVNDAAQLELLLGFEQCRFDRDDFAGFAIEDERLINPALWSL